MQNRTPAQHCIDLLRSIGYPIDGTGPCRGISLLAVHAALLGERTTFVGYLNVIKQTPNLATRLQTIQAKEVKMVAEDVYFPIFQFLKKIAVIVNPQKYAAKPNESISQYDYEKISQQIASNHLNRVGGLSLVTAWCGHYDQQTLLNYVLLLEKTFLEDPSANFTFTLTDQDHEIPLSYDVKSKHWTLIDTIDLREIVVRTAELPAAIFAAFNKHDAMPFATHVFSTTQQKNIVKSVVDRLQANAMFADVHDARKYPSHHLSPLLTLAAQMGFASVVKSLLAQNVSVDAKALFYAVQNGHADVVTALTGKADFKSCHPQSGAPMIYIAAQHGHVAVIRALVKGGADLNVTWRNSNAGLVAAKHNHLALIEVLAELNFDLSQVCHGHTLANVAAQDDNVALLKILSKHKVKLLEAKSNLKSPFQIARENKRNNVMDYLQTYHQESSIECFLELQIQAISPKKALHSVYQEKLAQFKRLEKTPANMRQFVQELRALSADTRGSGLIGGVFSKSKTKANLNHQLTTTFDEKGNARAFIV